jgi:RNA polymerase-binding transcription factor DksA
MTMNTEYFKTKLLEEKTMLEAELQTVGRKNPSNLADWEGKEPEMDTDRADEGEVAEGIDGLDTNNAILNDLEIRYNEILTALKKIDAGTYGICEVNGETIEEDRLEANPAAKTCKTHMNA